MARARARQAGLTIVTDVSESSITEFLHKVSKKPRSGIEGINELTRQQILKLCAALESHVQRMLPAAINVGAEEDARTSEVAILTLHGVAVLALELLTRIQQPPPEQLLNTTVMLHDGVLISNLDPELGKLQVEMQDAVMRLCCAWWERQLPGSDFLVARTIPYVLLRAIQSLDQNRPAMVHMCYVIRDALELLDFEDETIRDTKRLLLIAAMHPSFLREAEGRRFIAGLFKLDPQLTRELGAILRNQIPSGQRFALEAYGEILFRAWRDTVGPCAVEVESELQALMQAAILASTPALAAALRVVLDGLHRQKGSEKRLNPAFVRLYDPILPRAFGAANAEVRRNAVNLLAAAFPIIDPDAPADENKVRLAQQLGLLMDGLMDVCPAVREASVDSCCRCLNYFWEIIPAATCAKIIGDITGTLAFDGSSKPVRIAVLRGLRKLVDSQHAQPVLKKALPSISGLLQDPDPGVREALADLLVAVSASRGLNLGGVAAPEELLEVIAMDGAPAVTRKISRILIPSYFPNAKEGAARLSALLRSKPEAGLSFCRNMVARFYPNEAQGTRARKSSSMEYTASVPVEHILQFGSDVAKHLLATAPSAAPGPAANPQNQSNRGKAASSGPGKAGKKRAKKKAPAPPGGSDEEKGAGEQQGSVDALTDNGAGAVAVQAEDDEDVVLDKEWALETEEGWLAILEGLAVIADGLGAAASHTEECSLQELDSAFPGETLTELLRVAEGQLRNPKAVKLVLQVVASLHMIPGAQRVRATLFERLVEGNLSAIRPAGDDEVMELDGHRGPQGYDAGILSQVLKTLATSSNGTKLVAILSAALGVRRPLPLRKPVASKKTAKAGAGNGDGQDVLEHVLGRKAGRRSLGLDGHGRSGEYCEDDDVCLGCKRSEPTDTLLLCDGCDAPCHTHCLRPALQEVPEDAWFCWKCESQLQAVKLPKAAAGRCISLLLQHEEGREALCSDADFNDIIKAMQYLALDEADEIVRLAQAGIDNEAESGPAEGDLRTEDERTSLLGDPWGSLSRYCRAALHRAMAALWRQAAGGTDDAGAVPTPRQTPASAKCKRRRQRVSTASEADLEEHVPKAAGPEALAADGLEADELKSASLMGFFEIVPVLELAMQTCGHLAELVLAEPCVAAQLAALQYSQGLLRVLHVVHQTELLNMSGQYVSTVSCLCNAQAVLTHAVLNGLAAQGGASMDQQACLSASLQVLLGIAQQMNEAIRNCPVAGSPGVGAAGQSGAGADHDDCDRLLSQQLAARMEAEAGSAGESVDNVSLGTKEEPAGDRQEVPPPGIALEFLMASLMALLCDAGVEPLLKGPVRASAAALVGELLAATRKVSRNGWLGTLCALAGQGLATQPNVVEDFHEALRAQNTAERDENNSLANDNDGACEEDGRAAGATREVRRRLQNSKKTAATAAAKALQGAAAKVSELLYRESPAVGTLATVLVRVGTAQKNLGHAMLLLARLASKALVRATDPPHSDSNSEQQSPDDAKDYGLIALGATALLVVCQAACPESEVQSEAQNQRARPSRRCGALAKEAAAQAARAESEAAAMALGLLRQAVHQVQGQVSKEWGAASTSAGGGDADDAAEHLPGLLQARFLAQQLVNGFGKPPVVVS